MVWNSHDDRPLVSDPETHKSRGYSMNTPSHLIMTAALQHMFDQLYFHDPYWLAAHNTLHSPTVLLLALVITWLTANLQKRAPRWIFWFLVACLFHSFVDVLTHHHDGPLIFFPFDWDARFRSPVSYWDRNYYGSYIAKLEIGLDVVLLIYIFAGSGSRCWRKGRSDLPLQPD
jgi:hypothetical protein